MKKKPLIFILLALIMFFVFPSFKTFVTPMGISNEVIFDSGTGTKDNPYIISTTDHFINFANSVNEGVSYLNKYISLANDIDFNGIEWTPIGYTTDRSFQGYFNGNNHIVKNFKISVLKNAYITPSDLYYGLGLFGYTQNSVIKNLKIENIQIDITTVSSNVIAVVGGVVAYNYSGTVDNCYADATIITKNFKEAYIGGLIGWNGLGTIKNSYSYGNIDVVTSSLFSSNLGGLVGYNNHGTIDSCFSSISISSKNTFETYAGGLVGKNSSSKISNCYSTGNVFIETYGINAYTGGLVGYNEKGEIVNSYAIGSNSTSYTEVFNNSINLTSIPDTSLSSQNGKTYIIDLSKSNANINKTLSIGNVAAVKLIGNPSTVYTDFNIVIKDAPYSLIIEFENFNFIGSSKDGTIYSDSSRNVYFISSGKANSIEGYTEKSVAGTTGSSSINMSKASVYFYGKGNLTITGGSGSNGSNGESQTGTADATAKNGGSGNNGGNGGTGVIAKNILINLDDNLLTINGGKGGNGGDGGKGNGTNGSSHTTSGAGGNGGHAGVGGNAIELDNTIYIIGTSSSNVKIQGGKGGNGGNGGAGGNAYNGNIGDNGGNGGNGSDGGQGGYAIKSLQATSLLVINGPICTLSGGDSGDGGAGGDGGNGGRGSDGVSSSVMGSGLDGKDGGNGGNGGNGGSANFGSDVSNNLQYSISEESYVITYIGKNGFSGSGGNGGAGGDGGNYAKWGLWHGKDGVGGKGGKGGKNGNGTEGKAGGSNSGRTGGSAGSKAEGVVSPSNNPSKSIITKKSIYSLYDTNKTWTEAKTWCETNRGHLVTITSPFEQEIINILLSGSKYSYSIGATDSENEGVFKWVNGEEFNYTNWNTGEPNNLNNEDYVYIYAESGFWNDAVATTLNGFIFEKERFETSTCDSIYILNDNYQYKSWTDANKYANSIGGYLATIKNDEEWKVVKDLIGKTNFDMVWLGATCKDDGKTWLWVDGSKVDMNSKAWYRVENDTYEPNSFDGTIYKEQYLGTWNNYKKYIPDIGWADFTNADSQIQGFVIEFNLYKEFRLFHNDYSGGIVGYSNGKITNTYYLDSLEKNHNYGGIALNEEQMSQVDSFVNWDFDSIWMKSGLYHYKFPLLKAVNYNSYEVDHNFTDINGIKYSLDILTYTATVVDYIPKVSTVEFIEIRDYVNYQGYNYKVISIGDNVFDGQIKLSKIVLPNTIEYIGAYAFNECVGLETFTIPSSVIEIGNFAFNKCGMLQYITIPSNVKKLGNNAFKDCTSLKSVTIGNGTTDIGEYAFANCTYLEVVSLGINIKNIGRNAFFDCTKLLSVYFAGDIPLNENIGIYYINGVKANDYANVFGTRNTSFAIYYNANSNGWDKITGWNTSFGFVKTSVYDYEVKNNGAASILNDKQIDNQGIYYILNPDKTATVGKSNEIDYTGFIANESNQGIVYIPSIVYFEGVRYEVRAIDNYAFSENDNIIEIVIPEVEVIIDGVKKIITIEKIGEYAFNNCSNLKSIYFYGKKPTVSNTSFANLNNDFYVVYLDIYKSNWDLWNYTKLYQCFITQSSEKENQVIDNYGLSYSISGNTAMVGTNSDDKENTSGFSNAHAVIPEYIMVNNHMYAVTTISRYAFTGNEKLESVVIGSLIEENGIKDCSFMGTTKLCSFIIPNNKNYAIDNIGVLYAVNDQNIKWRLICAPLGLNLTTYVIPTDDSAAVKTIEAYAFYQYKTLLSIDVKNVTEIWNNAFHGCTNLSSVKNIDNVREIKDEAFRNCALTTISFDSDLLSLGNRVFYENNLLNSVNVVNNANYFSLNGVLFGRNANNTLTLIQYPASKNDDLNYIIPLTINDINVTIIDAYAFAYAKVVNVSINNKITHVGENAFLNCTNLTKIEIGSSVKVIGSTVDIPDGYGSYTVSSAFENTTSLQKIIVNPNNKYFYSENGILFDKDITILYVYPAGLSRYTYTIPYTVKQVAVGAFKNNHSLIRVILPDSITDVKAYAFAYCYNLELIYFKGRAPLLGDAAFDNIPTYSIYYGREHQDSWFDVCGDSKNNWYKYRFIVKEYNAIQEVDDQQDTSGTYSIVVIDSNGNSLKNILVKLYAYDFKTKEYYLYDSLLTNSYGLATLDMPNIDELLNGNQAKIEVIDPNGVFYSYINTDFQLDLVLKMSYIRLTLTPSIMGVSCNGADINSQIVKINTAVVNHITIIADAYSDPTYKIKQVALIQNGEIIYALNGSWSTDNISVAKRFTFNKIPSSYFLQDTKIQLLMIIEDSNNEIIRVKSELNIDIFEFIFYEDEFELGLEDGIDIDIHQDVPFIGDTKLKIGLVGSSELEIKTKDDTITVAINITKELSKPENQVNNLNDYYSLFKRLVEAKKMLNGTISQGKDKAKLELELSGALEFKYSSSGIQLTKGIIIGSLKYKITISETIIVWVIPVQLEVEYEFGGEISFNLTCLDYDKELSFFENLDLLVQIELEASVTGRAGVGCSIVSVGIYGKVGLKLLLDVYPNIKLQELKLYGDMGLYFKYSGLFFKYEAKFSFFANLKIDKELVVYGVNDKGEYVWFPSKGIDTFAQKQMSAFFASSNYTMATREEYEYTDSWQMFEYNNEVYIIYLDNISDYSPNYDDYNYQKLVYRKLKIDGTWTEPFIIDPLMGNKNLLYLADCHYSIYQDGNLLYIAYTQMNKLISNSEDIAGNVGNVEAKVAVWNLDNNTWTYTTLTNDNYYDMNIKVEKVNGVMTVVWVKNTDNNLFGVSNNYQVDDDGFYTYDITNANSLWCSQLINDKWVTKCLVSNLNPITDYAIGLFKGKSYVSYITDSDCNLVTTSDRKVWLKEINSEEASTLAIDDEDEYLSVNYLNDKFVIYKDYNLIEINDYNVYNDIFDVVNYYLLEDYQIYTDKDGNTYLFYTVTEEKNNGLYCLYYDAIDKKWGKPVLLFTSSENNFIDFYTVQIDENYLNIYYLNTEIIHHGEEQNKNSTIKSKAIPLLIDTSVSSLICDYENMTYNQDTNTISTQLTFTFTNSSLTKVTKIDVYLTDPLNNHIYLGSKDILCLSGHTIELTIPLENINLLKEYYKLTVYAFGEDSSLLEDNSSSFRLAYSDMAIEYKHIVFGNDNYLLVYVINNGYYLSGESTTIYTFTDVFSSKEDSLDNALYELNIANLQYGQFKYYLINLGAEFFKKNNTAGIITIYVYSENEFDEYDNYKYISISEMLSTEVDETLVNSSNLEKTSITIVDFDFTNVRVQINPNGNVFEGIEGLNENIDYEISNNVITFKESYLKQLPIGQTTLKFKFNTGSSIQERFFVINNQTTKYKITWIVGDIVTTTYFDYGEMPYFTGKTEKPSTPQYAYVFTGWNKEIEVVTSDAIYSAQFNAIIRRYNVTFYNDDAIIKTEEVEYGKSATAPVNPSKLADAQYTYYFAGWDCDFSFVSSDMTIKAKYNAVTNKYTVTFYDETGTTILDTIEVEYGTAAIYNGLPIHKESTEKFIYEFAGWDVDINYITGNTNAKACFTEKLKQFTITWIVDDVITVERFDYGTTPTFKGKTDKVSTAQYSYVFIGWDKEIIPATKDDTYIAQFKSVINKYTVTFYNGNIIVGTSTVDYGSPAIPPANPSKASDAQFTYIFIGWDKDFSNVTSNFAVNAKYNSIINQYTVTFYDDDGITILGTSTVNYGNKASAPSDPKKASNAQFTYVFKGWDTDFSNVKSNLIVKAIYTANLNQYTYRFYDRDGNLLISQNGYYGDIIIAPEVVQVIIDGINKYTFMGFEGYTFNITLTGDMTFNACYQSDYVLSESDVNDLINTLGEVSLSSFNRLKEVYNQIIDYQNVYPSSYQLFDKKMENYNSLVNNLQSDLETSLKIDDSLFKNIISIIKLMSYAIVLDRKDWWLL